LFLAIVAKREASGIDTGAECGLGDDASLPHRGQKIVLADDVLSILDQIKQQVEDLRLDRNHPRSTKQLAAIRIERVVLKKIVQLAVPSRRQWRSHESNTASCTKIKEIVTAR
jgi:hypothetical protein